VLEIDPGVVAVGRRRLGVDRIPGLTVRLGDARTALVREPAAGYDLAVGDAFGGLAPPWQLLDEAATARRTAGAVPLTDDFAPVDQLLGR